MIRTVLSRRILLSLFISGCCFSLATAQDKKVDDAKLAAPITQGQRVYSIGHSFHVFMPRILDDIVKAAGIKDHKQVGLSSIGGSRVIQHWDVKDDRFKSKEMLKSGDVDVLTMAPIYLPDDGIENFVALAFENNPKIRITIQEFWLPFDNYTPPRHAGGKVDHNALPLPELKARHDKYFADMDAAVQELRKKHNKQTIYIAPVGQAVVALREQIVAGKVPGLKAQAELFTDDIGHATPPLQALVAYVHFAVTYRKSPVGLPAPAVLGGGKNEDKYPPELITKLQEIAWQAAVEHPLSGLQAADEKEAASQ